MPETILGSLYVCLGSALASLAPYPTWSWVERGEKNNDELFSKLQESSGVDVGEIKQQPVSQ